MEIIKETLDTPVVGAVDVLVLGAGPAGFSAAVCAARAGADVLLVEQSGEVGGVATTGLMSHWTGKTSGGFYEEILDRSLGSYNEKIPPGRIWINHEALKLAMLNMLEESGAKLLLHTFACGALMDGNRVNGAFIQNKSGRQAIRAKICVDATADGDIAASAGVPYVLGREEDGRMQPMTLMFQVAGVDLDRIRYVEAFEDTYELPEGDAQSVTRRHLETPLGHMLVYPSVFPGTVTLNMTNVTGVDGTNAHDLTRASVMARRQTEIVLGFLREHVPGFEEAYILKTASQIGVRETRHFKGLYTLTGEDILSARVFEDWAVARAHFNFDVHNLTGSGLDETGTQKHFAQAKGYTIPYRCFVPTDVDGLLLAGRCISGTHIAHSNFRVMPICANMGQAVGTAAALCARADNEPRALDARLLQARLIEQGAVAPE